MGPAHVSVSQPLCVCGHSYEAEAEASVIAVVRAIEFVQALRAKGLAIQRVHFQGDNLAVVAYLAGYGRLRRPGLVARFQSAWDTLARSHVCTTWEQVPRSANTVADRLAGDALKAALALKQQADVALYSYVSLYDAPSTVLPEGISLTPAVLAALHPAARAWTAVQLEVSLRQLAGAEVVITLPEPEPLHFPLIGTVVALLGAGHLRGISALRDFWSGQPRWPVAALDYIRSSAHPQGRYYCGAGIATLTRPMRLLALGPQVYEIDLVGAHYEALRHITNALGLQPALLPVAQARTTLEEGCPAPRGTWAALSPKRLLNYAINSSASRAIAQLHQGGIAFSSQAAKDVL